MEKPGTLGGRSRASSGAQAMTPAATARLLGQITRQT